MPIYEYECPKCGRFDVVQKMSDKPLTKNPDCKRADCPNMAEKVISAAAFHLKGSGWYKTDYSSSGTAGTSTTPDKSAGSADSKDSSTGAGASQEAPAAASAAKKGGCGSGCGCH